MAEKKKSTKKTEPTPEYDSQRETRVLLEGIRSDVKKIAEQVVANTTKLSKLDEIDVIKSELGLVRTAVIQNGKDIKKLEIGQQELKQEVKEIKQKLDTVTSDHENRLKKLEVV